jgi:hypothetical protein
VNHHWLVGAPFHQVVKVYLMHGLMDCINDALLVLCELLDVWLTELEPGPACD